MKNLILLQDYFVPIPRQLSCETTLSCCVCNFVNGLVLFLTKSGFLIAYEIQDTGLEYSRQWDLNVALDEESCGDDSWFHVSVVSERNAVVCVCHGGHIVSISEECTGILSECIELEGTIDGGISSCQWNSDQSIFIILSNTSNIISMTNTFDVLNEISLEDKIPGTLCSLSWSGDNDLFAISSQDQSDSQSRLRIFSHELLLTAVGRNVAEGDGSALKGLNSACVAYSPNGSLIAVAQQRVKGKHQIAFLERNGLRHGDFDIQLPGTTGDWSVATLHWNISSTLLAVGLRVQAAESQHSRSSIGVVQLYYRSNYHWYLKQQWTGCAMHCLGFDTEIDGRLYLTEQLSTATTGDESGPIVTAWETVARVVSVAWDITASSTADCTVAVVDGKHLRLTPLGLRTVPPPMFAYSCIAVNSVRHCCFWTCSPSAVARWGLAVLRCDDVVLMFQADHTGQPLTGEPIVVDLNEVMLKHSLLPVGVDKKWKLSFRSIAAQTDATSKESVVHLLAVASILEYDKDQELSICKEAVLIVSVSITGAAGSDNCLAAQLRLTADDHFITRATAWPAQCGSFGVGMVERQSSAMTVMCVSADDIQCPVKAAHETKCLPLNPNDFDQQLQSLTLPEVCTHFTIIVPSMMAEGSKGDDSHAHHGFTTSDYKPTAVGLSSKNRLYCGDTLLVAGASSFVLNEELQMLMFVTVGTRPHLHFVSLESLLTMDDIRHSEERQQVIGGFEHSEPRPVERGARVIASAAGAAKVVIQLPRGNLEAFEPRPLILKIAVNMIKQGDYFQCLSLLRRQRVDLNLIVDYDPASFLTHAQALVNHGIVESMNPDYLSLFISALTDENVCETKYRVRSTNSTRILANADAMANFPKCGKVAAVCEAVRNCLLNLWQDDNQVAVLNPILCTCARQNPPLLVEALHYIKTIAAKTRNLAAAVQSGLKYLAFLVDSKLMFDAALSICDFDMAKTIARQGQMDPKTYLPLLEGFAAIGRGHDAQSQAVALMQYKVHVHLKKFEDAVTTGIHVIELGLLTEDFNLTSPTFYTELHNIAAVNSLFAHAISRLAKLTRQFHTKKSAKLEQLRELLTRQRSAYGSACMTKLNYKEAIVSFLMCEPPCAVQAIKACRLDGNWQEALAVAAKFVATGQLGTDLAPARIAQEIVSEYREILEQGESELVGLAAHLNLEDFLTSPVSSATAASDQEDKAVLAASLAVNYCHDPETAVAMLISARKWHAAARVALSCGRLDLFHEEVGTAVATAGVEVVKLLQKQSTKLVEVVTQLSALWQDPVMRLEQVASSEPLLQSELQGGTGAKDKDVDDTRSEYSAATMTSNASYMSGMSGRSGTSTVSVLSNLSLSSASSVKTSSSSFSIQGIEHTLLSRGKSEHSAARSHINANSSSSKPRRQSRKEKKGLSGQGRDTWGLQRECQWCEELLVLGNVPGIVRAVNDLLAALMLLGRSSDHTIASDLKRSLDSFTETVQQHPAPVAPLYTPDWLKQRSMTAVFHFQDFNQLDKHNEHSRNRNTELRQEFGSWWQRAADGITAWRSSQHVSLL